MKKEIFHKSTKRWNTAVIHKENNLMLGGGVTADILRLEWMVIRPYYVLIAQ